MRNIIITAALFLFTCVASPAQEKYVAPKSPVKLPDGFVYVGDNKIMGAAEVDYYDWVKFLQHKRSEGGDNEAMKEFLPDTNQRNKALFYDKIYPKEFGEKSKFIVVVSSEYNFPVTGISKLQAQSYCDYLNETGTTRTQNIDGKKVKYHFEYRLPTAEEFIKANVNGMNTEEQKLVSSTGRNKQGCFLLNFKTTPQCKNDSIGFTKMSFGLLEKWSFWPNNIGLYNVQGNVAEMTAEDNKAIGGSYIHPITECQVNSINYYTKPEMWLGFRVIADIVYEK